MTTTGQRGIYGSPFDVPAHRIMVSRGAPPTLRSRFFQPHLLVGRRKVEQRVQPYPGLLDPWSNAMQRRRLKDRRMHDALVHEPLALVQQGFALAAIALVCLLADERVKVRIAA